MTVLSLSHGPLFLIHDTHGSVWSQCSVCQLGCLGATLVNIVANLSNLARALKITRETQYLSACTCSSLFMRCLLLAERSYKHLPWGASIRNDKMASLIKGQWLNDKNCGHYQSLWKPLYLSLLLFFVFLFLWVNSLFVRFKVFITAIHSGMKINEHNQRSRDYSLLSC